MALAFSMQAEISTTNKMGNSVLNMNREIKEITKEIIEYIIYAKEKGCSMQGPEDPEVNNINVLV